MFQKKERNANENSNQKVDNATDTVSIKKGLSTRLK